MCTRTAEQRARTGPCDTSGIERPVRRRTCLRTHTDGRQGLDLVQRAFADTLYSANRLSRVVGSCNNEARRGRSLL